MKTSILQCCYLIIQVLVLHSIFVASQEECQPARCSDTGPIIRFPFWLKGHQPEKCGFPGFALSCTNSNKTEFNFQTPVRGSAKNILFPVPVKALIQSIDYQNQVIHTSAVNSSSCLPKQLPSVNTSFAPAFSIVDEFFSGLTLFNCSADKKQIIRNSAYPVPCLSTNGYRVQAIQSMYSVPDALLESCRKMYNISYVPNEFLGPQEYVSYPSVDLHWPEPYCGNCELEGKYCRLQTNSANNETGCYSRDDAGGAAAMERLTSVAGLVIGLCIFLLLA